MVEIPKGTEVFHWLALVMKEHTVMDRFLGVSCEPTLQAVEMVLLNNMPCIKTQVIIIYTRRMIS
jgi:hypothetical protein